MSLKLVKSTSSENYPIAPQKSAVRKLTVKSTVGGVADLKNSYLIIKNALETTVNTQLVARNVSWGCYFDENNIVEYPCTAQIAYAELLVGGQSVQYLEDVNVRLVNMMVYKKNAEQVKKESNLGSYGFQRLENGSKAQSPAQPAVNTRTQGLYVSPFLSQSLDDGTSRIAESSSYREVASVVKLADIFSFCEANGVDNLNIAGREVEVRLQFEDRKQILTEFVNYRATYDIANTVLKPVSQQTLALDSYCQYVNQVNGTTQINSEVNIPASMNDLVTAELQFRTTSTYSSVANVPLYVGMPFCTWKSATATATKGANCFIITQLSLDGDNKCLINAVPYYADIGGVNVFIQPAVAGTAVTVAQVKAELGVVSGTAGNAVTIQVCALSGICDPVVKVNTVTDFSSPDNALNTVYKVNGLELVLVEKVGMQGQKQQIQFVNYLKDSDVIPANSLNYNKAYMLDPQVGAVFGLYPAQLQTRVGDGDVNLLSVSRVQTIANPPAPVSSGVVIRSMLNGQPCYTRDIVFSRINNDTVEPLYYHRLFLASQKLGLKLNNLSTVEHFMAKDGVNQHSMIVEPVEMSASPQQFMARLTFNNNTASRTFYLFKAQMQAVEI